MKKLTLKEVQDAVGTWKDAWLAHDDHVGVGLKSICDTSITGIRETHDLFLVCKKEEGAVLRYKLLGGEYVAPSSVVVTMTDSDVIVDFKVGILDSRGRTFKTRRVGFKFPPNQFAKTS